MTKIDLRLLERSSKHRLKAEELSRQAYEEAASKAKEPADMGLPDENQRAVPRLGRSAPTQGEDEG